MAHELDIIDGTAAFLGREDPWHHLGFVLGRAFEWADVEQYVPTVASRVNKMPLQDLLNPFVQADNDLYGMVREYDDKVLSVVGGRYEPIQAEEMYDFGSAIQGLFEAPLVSVAGLRKGRQFAFTYDLGASEVGGEKFKHHQSIIGSHDGSIQNLALRSSTVIVCANTMAAALMNGVNRITLRHTANVRDRMEQAVEVVTAARQGIEDFEQTVSRLQAKTVLPREFDIYLDGLLPAVDEEARTYTQREAARGAVRSLFRSPLTAGFENTGWAFVQAVNTFEQWSAPLRRAKGENVKDARAMRQFDALVKGGHPLTQRAAELVLV